MKRKAKRPEKPTAEAAVAPDRKDPKTGAPLPSMEHVLAARRYSKENQQ